MGILCLDCQQSIDYSIPLFVIEPELFGFRLTVHVRIEFKDNTHVDGLVAPFFYKVFQLAFVLARYDGCYTDAKTAVCGAPERSLYLLIGFRSAQPIVALFFAIDRNFEMAILPGRNLNRAVGYDHIVAEVLHSHFDNFFAHQRLAAYPRAGKEWKSLRLQLVKERLPALNRQVLRLFVFKEITVMTTQVAIVCHIDRADRVRRNTMHSKPRKLLQFV